MKLSIIDFAIILILMIGVGLAFHFCQKFTIDMAVDRNGKVVDIVKKQLFTRSIG